jgi:hypothetical protein
MRLFQKGLLKMGVRLGRVCQGSRTLRRGVVVVAGFLAFGSAVEAQEALRAGEAYATRFSGTIEFPLDDGSIATILDEAGTVGSVIDLRSPGFAADGRHWSNEPQRLPVTAGEVGQVFGIAIDTAEPANVYLTATSAFGLHQFDDESGWLPGQWGEGGPGGVYRLTGALDYAPELIAKIGLNGRENTGAALGNIVFDATHNQLFVSDLETGMIHRISTDGAMLSHFDHGINGRPNYFDAILATTQSLDPVAFDPASAAQIGNCKDAGGADAPFAATPSCWNFADFRRRVWGMALRPDHDSDRARLYYAVWGTEGFGNPAWAAGDAHNVIWSIGIDAQGEFDGSDVRLEIVLPALGEDAETARAVSDIAISQDGVMLIAERGGVRNRGLSAPDPFAVPHSSRVLRYVLNDAGLWEPGDRYDIGFNDRKDVGQPFIRANAAGGVDFGFGYDAEGRLDTSKPDAFVWATGDALCSPDGACFDPASGARTDTSQVHGLQGVPVELRDEVSPAGATDPYPAAGDPYPATALLGSYLIDVDADFDAAKDDSTKIGDVEIYDVLSGGGEPREGYDLEIDKRGEARCLVDAECTFTITVTNNGPGTYTGPIFIWDDMEPYYTPLVSSAGDEWICYDTGSGIFCRHDIVTLSPGESVQLTITVAIPGNYDSDLLINCAELGGLYTPDGSFDLRPFQIILTLLGYDPGPIDGKMGAKTRAAIKKFQEDNGLAPTGKIDEALVAALFPGMLGLAGDLDNSNDRDCHEVEIRNPPHDKVKSHLKAGSPHDKEKSHRKDGSPHDKVKSHLKTGSPHDKEKSHLKTGSPHDKEKSHLKTGSPHDKEKSHLKTGSPHDKEKSHLKTGSPHDKEKSHLKTGSPHDKEKSHLKTGSPHDKEKSHLKTGSPHDKEKSHLKTGSPHDKEKSHLKTGSPHDKEKSHLKTGSPHDKEQSHLKVGSPHDKEKSHQKDGSPHDKRKSHLKVGSPHDKDKSDRKLAP